MNIFQVRISRLMQPFPKSLHVKEHKTKPGNEDGSAAPHGKRCPKISVSWPWLISSFPVYYPEGLSVHYLVSLWSVTETQEYRNLPSEISFQCKEVLVEEETRGK